MPPAARVAPSLAFTEACTPCNVRMQSPASPSHPPPAAPPHAPPWLCARRSGLGLTTASGRARRQTAAPPPGRQQCRRLDTQKRKGTAAVSRGCTQMSGKCVGSGGGGGGEMHRGSVGKGSRQAGRPAPAERRRLPPQPRHHLAATSPHPSPIPPTCRPVGHLHPQQRCHVGGKGAPGGAGGGHHEHVVCSQPVWKRG